LSDSQSQDLAKGNLYIIAAPSGAGKTSLVHQLVTRFDHLKISISYTTRPMRPGEVDGEDYRFVDETEFQKMVEEKAFLEHAEVHNYRYGTSHEWVLRQLEKGVDVILEIDWQGARQIRQLFPSTVLIFILPPSRKALRERLFNRKQDDAGVIEQRLEVGVSEMAHYHEFDYLVVNDDFDTALDDLTHIVRAHRLECHRQRHVVSALLADLLGKQ